MLKRVLLSYCQKHICPDCEKLESANNHFNNAIQAINKDWQTALERTQQTIVFLKAENEVLEKRIDKSRQSNDECSDGYP